MSTSSSTAAERDFKREFLKVIFILFGVLLICFSVFFVNHHETNKFIIETHSDFTINRFRYKLHSSKEDIDFNSKVLFFERTGEGNKITTINIEKNGSYAKKVPTNYRDFFIDEELKLLEL